MDPNLLGGISWRVINSDVVTRRSLEYLYGSVEPTNCWD